MRVKAYFLSFSKEMLNDASTLYRRALKDDRNNKYM